MVKKKLNSKFYSLYKIKYDRKNNVYNTIRLDNNCLFANGIYPTKIALDDLSDDYIYGRYYGVWGYVSSSGVKDLFFRESISTQESMKNDALYISYSDSLNIDAFKQCDFANYNEDFVIYGHTMLDFIEKILKSEEYNKTEVCEKALIIKDAINNRLNQIKGDK